MTLIVKIDAPQNGATVTASPVTVTGRVSGSESGGAKVTINGADATVKDRKFSGTVVLTEGKNEIAVIAQSGQANLSEKVTVTYAPAKQ
ncbi:MAG: hypothetical protein ACYC7J_18825 [Syntrophales bacterium]